MKKITIFWTVLFAFTMTGIAFATTYTLEIGISMESEPATMLLIGTGMVGIGRFVRKKRSEKK